MISLALLANAQFDTKSYKQIINIIKLRFTVVGWGAVLIKVMFAVPGMKKTAVWYADGTLSHVYARIYCHVCGCCVHIVCECARLCVCCMGLYEYACVCVRWWWWMEYSHTPMCCLLFYLGSHWGDLYWDWRILPLYTLVWWIKIKFSGVLNRIWRSLPQAGLTVRISIDKLSIF